MKLRLMSNNLWWCDLNHDAWAEMGENCSNASRAPGFARLYGEVMPHVIGFQECSGRMGHTLMMHISQAGLPYAMLWGKDTPIAYRKDLFELVDSWFYLYPEEIPGLEGAFNNLNTKSYSIALLRLKETGQLLLFATTHLWYKSDAACPGSEDAKAWQVERLVDKLDELQGQYDCPAVVVGDFNTWPAAKAIRAAKARGFAHAHDVATEFADETCGHHFCCDKGFDTQVSEGGFEKSLDHILVRGVKEGAVCRYERSYADYYMPLSDHFPLWIDMEL